MFLFILLYTKIGSAIAYKVEDFNLNICGFDNTLIATKINPKNKKIETDLHLALWSYVGPQFTITSAFRDYGYKKSKHRHGKAIDIHYSSNLVDYFISEEGSLWLESFGLKLYIEDCSRKKLRKMPSNYQKYIRYISHATGLHIHLELK